MCVYCYCGDQIWRWDPPYDLGTDWVPQVPKPVTGKPIDPWPLEKLQEYLELLKKIKQLEDTLGCPCEPNKADYIRMFEDRIAELEKNSRP